MPVHQLESVNFATVMDKMREILNRLQERPCPPGSADSSSLLASYPMGSINVPAPGAQSDQSGLNGQRNAVRNLLR